MTTKLTLDEANKRIAELEAELKRLKELTPPGLSGWLVKTANRTYTGMTLGINFRNGQAFISDGADAEQVARQMADDLGYDVQRVDDWRQVNPGDAEQVKRSMIDVLQVPQAM